MARDAVGEDGSRVHDHARDDWVFWVRVVIHLDRCCAG